MDMWLGRGTVLGWRSALSPYLFLLLVDVLTEDVKVPVLFYHIDASLCDPLARSRTEERFSSEGLRLGCPCRQAVG